MKKIIPIIIILIITALTVSVTFAQDIIIDQSVTKILNKIDKNENAYRVLIIKLPKTMNGLSYEKSIPVFAFIETVNQTDGLVEGDRLKAVVNIGKYEGKERAILLKVIR